MWPGECEGLQRGLEGMEWEVRVEEVEALRRACERKFGMEGWRMRLGIWGWRWFWGGGVGASEVGLLDGSTIGGWFELDRRPEAEVYLQHRTIQ